MTKPLRMADPLWVECCKLWDQLTETDRSIVVKAMEYMAEKAANIKDESPTEAEYPEES